jgi:hypothetical protein
MSAINLSFSSLSSLYFSDSSAAFSSSMIF